MKVDLEFRRIHEISRDYSLDKKSKHTLPGSRLVIKTEDGGNLRKRWAFLYAESHTMSKKGSPSIKLLSNNGIMCTKKAFKIFIK